MEKLVDSGLLAGVIDVTTTEIADEIVGGVLSAGPTRLDVVRAPRACPTSARAARSTWSTSAPGTRCPSASAAATSTATTRHVTLMRTTADEMPRDRRASSPTSSTRWTGPVRFLIPEGGVSADRRAGPAVPRPGGRRGAVRRDRAATSAPAPTASCVRLPLHINDQAFADALVAALREVVGDRRARPRRRDRPCPASPARRSSSSFRAKIARGEPIIGGGAGTGLSAKCEEAGGIDLIVIYNSGRYRMAGRGSLAGLLAYGNANEIVLRDGARGAAGGASARRCSPASTAPTRS